MKKKFAAALALIMSLSMVSCGNFGRPDPKTLERVNEDQDSSRRSLVDEMFPTDEESSVSDNVEYTIEDDPENYVKVTVENMTLEEKIGQLFFVRADALETGYENKVVNDDSIGGVTYVDDMMIDALEKYHVGGVVLMEKNIMDEDKLIKLTSDLQVNSDYPLFIGVEEIGGELAPIANNKNFAVPLFGNMNEVGETAEAANAKKVGKTIGKYLASYGINLDFAPIADVSLNEDKVKESNFAADLSMVASMVEAEIDGLHEAGIMTTVKHFPGYGDGSTDKSKVPENGFLWERIMEESGLAFTGALNKTDMLMVGHIMLPAVSDDGLPASMSQQIIQGKIRDELKFRGVVITDAMSAKCITENYVKREIAVNAIIAGADMILMPYDLDEAYDSVLKAVEDGKISEARIDKSVERILWLKVKNHLFDDYAAKSDDTSKDTDSDSSES
ncbi:glycoside hydrolase family 3 protein [Ruminococcus albus]|uniref:beta-N-acetylhexosaminidase n=1 Tax=Ruminococcus albus TaxID=1264 RepID=A0A1H7FLC0_RUMAL|nr:glycoside hydrolase family 3 N-terminal domain-containing protein [Ruminococcus albus]SEK24920.1 beta-N-acetylhexosaminidase [Ruminococcus albus]